MLKEGKIGVQEAVCLVTITISNQIFFTAPTILAQAVGTTGWYTALISNAVTLFAFTIIYLLLKRFPQKDIVEVFNITLGKFVGFIFSFIFAASFLMASGILLREFASVVKVYVLPLTPIDFIILAFVIAAVIAAFLGLESIARFAKLAGYICLFSYLLILTLAANSFDFSNIFPVYGYGIGITVWEGITRSSVYSQIILVAVFARSLQGIKHVKKVGYLSLILSGLIISAGLFVLELIFPYAALQELTSPIYSLTRQIRYGAFLQRFDPLFVFLWNITTLVSISILFYAAVSTYCKTFRLQDARPIVIIMAPLLFTVAIFSPDFSTVIQKYVETLRKYAILVFYIFPLVALVAAIIRKKGNTKSQGNKNNSQ